MWGSALAAGRGEKSCASAAGARHTRRESGRRCAAAAVESAPIGPGQPGYGWRPLTAANSLSPFPRQYLDLPNGLAGRGGGLRFFFQAAELPYEVRGRGLLQWVCCAGGQRGGPQRSAVGC